MALMQEADCPLYLEIAGRRFGGWQRVRVTRSVETASTQFGVVATRSWPGGEGQWWIQAGDKVVVKLNEEIVCTGWIDTISPAYDASSHSIQISGRGMVADLVDCSYIGPPWQWKNSDAATIIRAIAAPFSISVVIEADLGAPLDFTIQQGESGWEAIDRICRLRQVLAYEQADGSLLITLVSPEYCPTALVQGGNILAATGDINDSDRFSQYIVKGQQVGNDSTSPSQAAQSMGEVTDPSIQRYRPLLMVQSADTDNGTALDRASWEKQQRWGKAREATITVQGWLQPNGQSWPINRRCRIEDTWLGLDRVMCIAEATLEAGSPGLRTILKLQPPEALTPDPPDATKADAGDSTGGGESGPSFWEQVATDREAGEQRRKESKQ